MNSIPYTFPQQLVNIYVSLCACVSETRGASKEDSQRLHAQQGPNRPEGDSTVPREGRLHCQGVGGSLHAAKIQDHEEQILRLVDRYVVLANLNLFINE